MQFSKQSQEAISKILVLLHVASSEFAKLSNLESGACFDFHNQGSSLNHCLRWGESAAIDIQAEITAYETKSIQDMESKMLEAGYYIALRDPAIKSEHQGLYMITDLLDKVDGYQLVRDNRCELIKDAYKHLFD